MIRIGRTAAAQRRADPSFARSADTPANAETPLRTNAAAKEWRRTDPSFARTADTPANAETPLRTNPAAKERRRADPSFAKSAGTTADTATPSRPKPPAKKRQPLIGSVLSALLHLAIFALLLWQPPLDKAGNGAGAEEATITVAFIPLGEGQGQEPAQAGKHAAEPDATTGAPPTAPELAAPSDSGAKATAAAPEAVEEAKPEPTRPEPPSPSQQPSENLNKDESLNEQPREEPSTETPPAATKPLNAAKAPETLEKSPAAPSTDQPPPVEKKVTETPALPKELRPKASAPPPPSAAQPKVAELPPAAKIIEAPPAPESRLPPKSAFKPGTLGDIKRTEILGRVASLAGEVGGSGSAQEAGGGIGAPGPPGGGTPTERHISELQARIDRMLLVYQPDYPDVVVLQRQVDKLFADEGPLKQDELAETGRRLEACWQRARAGFGLSNRAVDLNLVLDRDGSIRDAKLADAELRSAVPAKRLADAIRACGPLPLPPERYLLWQNLTMQVGGAE
jgi:hypothetical protein